MSTDREPSQIFDSKSNDAEDAPFDDDQVEDEYEGEDLIPSDLSTANEDSLVPVVLKQAMSLLVTRGAFFREDKPAMFEALRDNEEEAGAFFASIFMVLVINPSSGLAIIQPEDTDVPHNALVRPRSLSLYDSVVLVQLRKHYQEKVIAGEEGVYIDVEEIEQAITPLLPVASSETRDRSKLNAALSRFGEQKILRKAQGRDKHYEITPVIQHVVNGDMLAELEKKYRSLAGDHSIDLAEESADE